MTEQRLKAKKAAKRTVGDLHIKEIDLELKEAAKAYADNLGLTLRDMIILFFEDLQHKRRTGKEDSSFAVKLQRATEVYPCVLDLLAQAEYKTDSEKILALQQFAIRLMQSRIEANKQKHIDQKIKKTTQAPVKKRR